mmetsp:Transcript_26287/g.70109  ORF Transcript_26287/g.70109 Transcript_26287/m.70109 type:complete len:203 (-) Transcript_26287:539-1147(-)
MSVWIGPCGRYCASMPKADHDEYSSILAWSSQLGRMFTSKPNVVCERVSVRSLFVFHGARMSPYAFTTSLLRFQSAGSTDTLPKRPEARPCDCSAGGGGLTEPSPSSAAAARRLVDVASTSPNQSSEKMGESKNAEKLAPSSRTRSASMVKSQYGSETAGSTVCSDRSNSFASATWLVKKPSPSCKWSHSASPASPLCSSAK